MRTTAMITGLCLLVLMLPNPGVCGAVQSFMPETQDEQRLWQLSTDAVSALERSNRLYQDSRLQAYLNRLIDDLRRNIPAPSMPFRARVLLDHQLDGYAYPNGVCFIHTGLLARLENEAQLALLLAHEMIHVFNRHALIAYRHTLAGRQTDATGNAPHVIPSAFRQTDGSRAAWMAYRDQAEMEADREGLSLIVAAGYDPAAAIGLFDLLKTEFESGIAQHTEYDHAQLLMPRRIKAYHTLLESLPAEDHLPGFEPSRFNTILQPLRLANIRLDLKVGRLESALHCAQRLHLLDPHDPIPCYLLGEIYRRQATPESLSKAKAFYREAIDRDADYADPYRALGLVHYRAGEKDVAKVLFQTCLALAPQAPENTYIRHYLSQCRF